MSRDLTGMFDSIKEIVLSAIALIRQDKQKEANGLIVKLNSKQLTRPFCGDGGHLPVDPELRACAFCEHGCIDEPPTNKTQAADMKNIREEQHRKAAEKFDQTQKNGGTFVGKKGMPLKTAPKLNEKGLIFHQQCHCC